MNTLDVTFVRIYLTEGEGRMEGLLKRLHDEEKVQGVTVFRGFSPFWTKLVIFVCQKNRRS